MLDATASDAEIRALFSGAPVVEEDGVRCYVADDILFPVEPTQEEELEVVGAKKFWRNGIVHYELGPMSPAQSGVVTAAMRAWSDGTAFRFERRTNQAAYVRFLVSDTGRNSSRIGRTGGAQNIRIVPQMWNVPTIAHEIGHALGLWHEHQRPDRETFVDVDQTAASPAYDYAINWARLGSGQTAGPYDFHSIMHYLPNAGAKPGKTVITCKGQYAQFQGVIGRAAGPSPADRSELMKQYRAAGFI